MGDERSDLPNVSSPDGQSRQQFYHAQSHRARLSGQCGRSRLRLTQSSGAPPRVHGPRAAARPGRDRQQSRGECHPAYRSGKEELFVHWTSGSRVAQRGNLLRAGELSPVGYRPPRISSRRPPSLAGHEDQPNRADYPRRLGQGQKVRGPQKESLNFPRRSFSRRCASGTSPDAYVPLVI